MGGEGGGPCSTSFIQHPLGKFLGIFYIMSLPGLSRDKTFDARCSPDFTHADGLTY